MRIATPTLISLLAVALFAGIGSEASAQQRFRQLLEQRRAATPRADLPAGTRIERDIAYGNDPKQRYDVYLPAHAQPGAPILFMVHGGGWRRGDKASPGVVGNKAAYWLNQGFVFVSANNRLVPDADPMQQAEDVAAAIASVQQHAHQWNADPGRMLLMGHSAGAHLVVLVATKPDLLRKAGAQRPLGVVSLDSGALDVPSLMGQARVPELYRNAFGSDPAFWRSVSPQQQLDRRALPLLLVCSSTRHFPTSPCDEARKLASRANAASVPAQVLPEALQHGEINSQLGLPSAYTQAVAGWITNRVNTTLTQIRR
ncbi:alpha/beta hydrolase [Thermomonas sp.]|uniref:alpha/beta hydrolase n=1 Tax=Thermomonas sp. TaxID=1971895 RepID=UPI002625B00F|nr:alpha/beta hydrolase [Thermomonas sp.]MCO5054962.1 alpha/beta hydrolase [Thermomonas sp.]